MEAGDRSVVGERQCLQFLIADAEQHFAVFDLQKLVHQQILDALRHEQVDLRLLAVAQDVEDGLQFSCEHRSVSLFLLGKRRV